MRIPWWLAVACAFVAAPAAKSAEVDLTHATVVVGRTHSPVERNACRLLVEEAARRTGVTWRVSADIPAAGPVILLGTSADPPPGVSAGSRPRLRRAEVYRLRVRRLGNRSVVTAIGSDASGCMFAAGRLLREARLSRGRASIATLDIETAPVKPLRGMHIGWSPHANGYSRWTAATFEQYVRDMVVWGINAVELVFNELDVSPGSAPLTNSHLARIASAYGMRVWLWYSLSDVTPPGVAGAGLVAGKTVCPSQPDGRRYLLERRQAVFRHIRRLDAVFVPGGDPGGCTCDRCKPWPRAMLPLVAEIARELRAVHPRAQVWVSNQGFHEADNQWLYGYLRRERPRWLTGLVFGPWAEETVASMRAKAPLQYPIRLFSDITHTVRCQYPVRDWDVAYAQTLGREPPLYRLHDQAHIARLYQGLSVGAIPYTETVTDDLHEVVWASVLWDPASDPKAIARTYARYFLGPDYEEDGLRGILGLERNWQGPLLTNTTVPATHAHWQRMAGRNPEPAAPNWRFQMALLAATYARYLQLRLQDETAAERRILAALSAGGDPVRAVKTALEETRAARARCPAPHLHDRLWELGQALHESIGLQLSTVRWKAPAWEHGAILDFVDAPISNLPWMEAEMRKLQELTDSAAVRQGTARILRWEDPGPGGFYDDLGSPGKQPHLVRQRTWREDPGYVQGTRTCFIQTLKDARQSWCTYAETLFGTPLLVRYTGLDRAAQYTVRAVYCGRYNPVMTLTADGRYTVHGPVKTPDAPTVLEWPVPRAATASGALTLRWDRVQGRGCQVSEVWLVRR